MKWHLVYFVPCFIHSLWWLQSPGIITCNSVLVPLTHAIISMLELAPRFIFLDEDINTIVTPTAPAAIHTRPTTRARARQLNYQVLLFLGNDSNVHENMMLPKLDTFVLLTNEGPSLEKDEHWSKNKHGDDAMCKGTRTELQVMISGL